MAPTPVNEQRLVDTFLTLCRFNTPPRHERPASEWAGEYLRKIGFTVEWDDAGEKLGGDIGNLIAFKKGTVPEAPPIFFSSHFDTVEATPGLEIAIEGDIIRATSDTILGADNKCGVAPILEAVTLLAESGEPHGDIQLLLTICEEIGLVGAREMDPRAIRGKYGFVLDTEPPLGTLLHAAPAQNSFHVRIEGAPAHAGIAPENGISAIVAAAKAVSAMRLGRIDEETTANVGIIHGGTARNIVPAEVELSCEARSHRLDKLDAQTAHMVDTFEREAAAIGAVAHVTVTEQYRGYALNENDTVIRLALAGARAAGLPPAMRPSGGGSDANVFNSFGVPTTVLACGMEKIHTHDEFCRISSLIGNARWVLEIIRVARDLRE